MLPRKYRVIIIHLKDKCIKAIMPLKELDSNPTIYVWFKTVI